MKDSRHDRSFRFRVYLVVIISIPLLGYGGTYMYRGLLTLDSIACDYRLNEITAHIEKMPEQGRKECEGLKQFGFISSIGLLIPISISSFFLVRKFIYAKSTHEIQKVNESC